MSNRNRYRYRYRGDETDPPEIPECDEQEMDQDPDDCPPERNVPDLWVPGDRLR